MKSLSASSMSVSLVMRRVIYALLPAITMHIYLFGLGLLWNILLGVLTALLAETVMLKIRARPVWLSLLDFSAVLTAVLLAYALPPYAPWWLVVVANLSAIIVAKHLYGGLGQNPFNPAMVGYAVALISFPLEMSRWPKPLLLQQDKLSLLQSVDLVMQQGLTNASLDMISSASPLETWRAQRVLDTDLGALFSEPLFGQFGYAGGEWVALAIAAGGVWLLWQRIINWYIPFGLLAAVAITASLFYFTAPAQHFLPLSHLVLGATMLAAFFIATDPVTAPAAPRAQLVYGASIGMLIVIIRVWGGFPDGVAFAVLIMNMCAPMLDTYLKPRVFGTGRLRS